MKATMARWMILFSLVLSVLACQCSEVVETEPPESQTTLPTETPALAMPAETPTPTTPAAGEDIPETPNATPWLAVPQPELSLYAGGEIFAVEMLSPSNGWAVAEDRSALLVTLDGGETWLDATPPDLNSLPEGWTSLAIDPFFLSVSAWFTPNTTGDGILYHTQDLGGSWESYPLPFMRGSFFFINLNDGFALEGLGAGAGSHYVALHRTDDGGASWEMVFSHEPGESKSLPEGGTKNGITFLNQDRGWIGGSIPMTDYFHFYITEDGGATWSQETDITLPVTFGESFLDVYQPFFVNESTGYLPVRATTLAFENYLLVYRSDDAGETWAYQDAILNGVNLDFIDREHGWMAAETNLFRTADAGASWEPVSTSGIPGKESLIKVDFVDELHGWVLTLLEDGTTYTRHLYRTTDGGETWSLLSP